MSDGKRRSDASVDNGPEDLLLEELVRKWKWAAAQHNRQRQPQLMDMQLPEEADDDMDDMIQYQPRINQNIGQKHFAYRPHEPGFRNRRPPELDTETEILNPLIQSGRFPYSYVTCRSRV